MIILKALIFFAGSCLAKDGKVLRNTDFSARPFNQTSFRQSAEMREYYHKNIVPKFKAASKNIEVKSIDYESDGLKVKGFFLYPKSAGKFPLLIFNRGGNGDYGKIEITTLTWLSKMAERGFVIAASQYRGNDGGQGFDEFGGEDLNDVFNIVKAASSIKNVDSSRYFIMGHSRGGMMTYQAIRNNSVFKAAIVMAGECDLFLGLKGWPQFEQVVYEKRIPDYKKNKKKELIYRSACFWPKDITTPILIFQGLDDRSVLPNQAKVAQKTLSAVVDVEYFNGHHNTFFTSPFDQTFFSKAARFFNSYP